MKKVLSTLVVLLAASPIWAAGVQGAPLTFYDDFDDGNDDGWTQVDRDWHVRDGRYHLDGDYRPDATSRDGFAFTHVGDPAWTDYVFEFTFDTTNAPSDDNSGWEGTSHVHQVFVAFRVVQAKATKYRLGIWVPGDRGSNTCLEKYVDSDRPLWTECADPVARLGTNTGKVVVTGGHIQVYVNSQLTLDYTDPDPIPYGGVGLGAIWEVNAWFDDVRVASAIPATVDLLPPVLTQRSGLPRVIAFIRLPEGYDPADIDVGSVRLEGVIPAARRPTWVFKCDDDRAAALLERAFPDVLSPAWVPDCRGDRAAALLVTFGRRALMDYLGGRTGKVTLTVSGTFHDGVPFEGSDTIRVIAGRK